MTLQLMMLRSEIRTWLNQAREKPGCTHVVIVCDTLEHLDYPVEVMSSQDWRTVVDSYSAMLSQRVLEVYDLSQPIEPQLAAARAWPKPSTKKEEQPVAQDKRYLVLVGESGPNGAAPPVLMLCSKDELLALLNERWSSNKEIVSALPGHTSLLEQGQVAILKFEVVVPEAKVVRKEYSIE